MNIRKNPKYKIDRRLGVNLWGRPKSPFNKRESSPGEHGQRNKKYSDYSELEKLRNDNAQLRQLIKHLKRQRETEKRQFEHQMNQRKKY